MPFSMRHGENLSTEFSKYFVKTSDYGNPGGIRETVSRSVKIIYSREAARKIDGLISAGEPDIAHLYNIYHQISSAVIPVLKKRGVPVVMTLHGYKMVCPTYAMLRRGLICEKCRNGRYHWCLLHRCTKNSYWKSLVNVIEMTLHHRICDMYDGVDIFIAPSRFL